MLKTMLAAGLALGAGCGAPSSGGGAVVGLASRPPDLGTPHVRGEGVEARFIRGTVGIGEVHEALVLASSQRRTDAALEHEGIEVHLIDETVTDALTRGLVPPESPDLGWMGLPVQWRRVAQAPDREMLIRGWPIVTELGPRTVLELALRTPDDPRGLIRREFLLRPGQALAVTAGLGTWPEPVESRARTGTVGATMFGWDRDSGLGTGMLVLIPRYGGPRR